MEGLACLAGKVNQSATNRGRAGDPDGPASDETRPFLRGTTGSAHGPGERKCGDAKSSTFALGEGGYQEGEGVLGTQRFPGERLDVKDLSTLSSLSYSPSPVVGTSNGQDSRFSFALRKNGDGHENQRKCGERRGDSVQAGFSRRRSRPVAQYTAARSIGNPTEMDTADTPDTWPSNHVANSAIGQKMAPMSKCHATPDAASTNPPEATLGNCATGHAEANTDHLADPPDQNLMEDSLLEAAGTLVGAREQRGGSEGTESVAPAESERGTRAEVARGMEKERTLKALSPSALTPPSSSCPPFSSLARKDVDARRARRPPSRHQPSDSTIVSGEGDLDDPSLRGVEATTVEKRAAGTKERPRPEFGGSSERLGEGPGVNREAALDAVEGLILEVDSTRENDDGATGRAWKHELEAGLSSAWPCSAGGDELALDDQGFLDLGALEEEETPELGERVSTAPSSESFDAKQNKTDIHVYIYIYFEVHTQKEAPVLCRGRKVRICRHVINCWWLLNRLFFVNFSGQPFLVVRTASIRIGQGHACPCLRCGVPAGLKNETPRCRFDTIRICLRDADFVLAAV